MNNLFASIKLMILCSFIPVSCGSGVLNSPAQDLRIKDDFKDYWFQGKAEISSYDLQQARYGEMRTGKAVLIFVTEDFSQKKQVKLDRPAEAGRDAVKVMKMNLTKKFNTGIYPYSMMQSVFTPIALDQLPHSLKLTTSSQEWCGHTFTQLNLQSGNFAVQSYSYFEQEGDLETRLDGLFLEDEIWNRIRIAPGSLPQGDFKIIPGTLAQRLMHIPLEEVMVTATLGVHSDTEMVYELQYRQPLRNLKIYYQKAFPHKIQGWEETYMDGFGDKARMLTTRASLDHTLVSDYWTKNSNADSHLRHELGLDP